MCTYPSCSNVAQRIVLDAVQVHGVENLCLDVIPQRVGVLLDGSLLGVVGLVDHARREVGADQGGRLGDARPEFVDDARHDGTGTAAIVQDACCLRERHARVEAFEHNTDGLDVQVARHLLVAVGLRLPVFGRGCFVTTISMLSMVVYFA